MDNTIMTFSTIESQAIAPFMLEQHSCFPTELEIDGVVDKHVGVIYRVWIGRLKFTGAFLIAWKLAPIYFVLLHVVGATPVTL
jgi:hypothetical protein